MVLPSKNAGATSTPMLYHNHTSLILRDLIHLYYEVTDAQQPISEPYLSENEGNVPRYAAEYIV